MTLNVKSHEKEISSAFDNVSRCPNSENWIILDYEGNSNVLKLGDRGDGGIEELSTSFNSGKLQFGVAAVRCTASSQPKMILIQWQGEGVPSARLAATTAHGNDLKRFLRGIHVVIIARSEDDVDPDSILKAVAKLPTMNDIRRIEDVEPLPQGPVGSVYMPIKPNRDIDLSERDQFWKKVEQEESSRKVEETKRAHEQAAQANREKQELSRQIHAKLNITDVGDGHTVKEGNKSTASKSNGNRSAAGDSLIKGRRAMFEQKANEQSEQIQRSHTPTRGVTFPSSPKMTSPVPIFNPPSSPKVTSPVPPLGHVSPMAQRQVSGGKEMEQKREEPRTKFDSQPETAFSFAKSRNEPEPETTGVISEDKTQIGARGEGICGSVADNRGEGGRYPRDSGKSQESGNIPVSVNAQTSINQPSPVEQQQIPVIEPVRRVEEVSKEVYKKEEVVENQEDIVENTKKIVENTKKEVNIPKMSQNQSQQPQSYYEEPPAEDLRAVALWDYQAADDTEITFDPDEIITEIDQIDEGWWRGRGPDGRVGLFPANYVALI